LAAFRKTDDAFEMAGGFQNDAEKFTKGGYLAVPVLTG